MEMFIRQILLFLLFITKKCKNKNKNKSTIRYTNRIAARIVIATMKRRDLFINSLTAWCLYDNICDYKKFYIRN